MVDNAVYTVAVVGCDDHTTFNITLTPTELETVVALAKKCNETSSYGCMPTIHVAEGADVNVFSVANEKLLIVERNHDE